MINRNVTINLDRLKSYRDPIGYLYAKWFDEPFIVDMLNEMKFKNFNFTLAGDEDDRKHIDIYASNGSETITIDCKIMTHNFEYDNGNVNKLLNKSYADVVTIGEYALMSDNTEYILFVRANKIYMCKLQEIRTKVKPLVIREKSKAIGGSAQTLFNYRVDDLINLFSTLVVNIPDGKSEMYRQAYNKYEYSREKIRSIHFDKVLSNDKKNEAKIATLNDFKYEIEKIIDKYNKVYVEIPKIEDTDKLLNDIYIL